VALLSGDGRRLRTIAGKLAEKAEQGDLQAIQQIADRLDGKPAQAIKRSDVPIEAMTDQHLWRSFEAHHTSRQTGPLGFEPPFVEKVGCSDDRSLKLIELYTV
jgi:hypothetical protein